MRSRSSARRAPEVDAAQHRRLPGSPDRGSLSHGRHRGLLARRERARPPAGRRIGFIFQTFNLLAHRTVAENVMLAEVYLGGRAPAAASARSTCSSASASPNRASFLPGEAVRRPAAARSDRSRSPRLPEPAALRRADRQPRLRQHRRVLGLFDTLRSDGHHDPGHHPRRRRRRAHAAAHQDRRRAAHGAAAQRPEPLRDLLTEALAGLTARPARVALTVLGTVIGVAALVATLGLSKTASQPDRGTLRRRRRDRHRRLPRPPPCEDRLERAAVRGGGAPAAAQRRRRRRQPLRRRRPRGPGRAPSRSTTRSASRNSSSRSRPRRRASGGPPARSFAPADSRRRPLRAADRVAVLGRNAADG